jgi:hypothetical protein
MFKRFFWLTVGTAVGFGGSFWAQRRLRRTIQRYYPEQVARHLGKSTRSFGGDLLAAAREDRTAMQEREAALRSRLPRSGR